MALRHLPGLREHDVVQREQLAELRQQRMRERRQATATAALDELSAHGVLELAHRDRDGRGRAERRLGGDAEAAAVGREHELAQLRELQHV